MWTVQVPKGLKKGTKSCRVNVKTHLHLNYEDFMKRNREEARELIKGKRVLYIYHNKIDSTGDKQSSENSVFNAVEETIFEIKEAD